MKPVVPGLRALAALVVLLTTLLGATTSVAAQGGTVDVAIFTDENGQPAYDACYVLVDFSNEGCDENGDGKVMFADIPYGTYTVHQTADLGPGRSVADFTINVIGNRNSAGFESFAATINSTGGNSTGSGEPGSSGAKDISLITREPDSGDLLTGTCYVLVDYSNEGCDENGDGQVTFDAIPYGAYTVHQTRTPAGYPTINDYTINVEPVEGMPGGGSFGVPLGFIVKQAPEQNAPDTRNVSVVLIDMTTREKVVTDVCVELVGASNVGCDDDLPDGQIDFLDVPAGGPYELRFTNLPAGYEVATVGGPLAVTIAAGPGSASNQMVFVLLAGPGSASNTASPSGSSDTGGTRNGSTPTESDSSTSITLPSSGSTGASSSSGTRPTAQDVANGGLWSMGIGARTVEAGIYDHTVGARFIVTSEEGEYIGECTLDEPPDLGVAWWNCRVDVPSDRISLVWEDLDSIPTGYAPVENPIAFDPTTYETGPHNIGAFFENIPISGSTSNSSGSTEAMMLMTFRGCPEEFDPNTDDFYANCTIPLDAPDASIIAWGGDGQGGMNITGLERQYNGEYVYTAGPNTMSLQLSGLAPVVRDAYQVFGADGVIGDTYTVNLVNGETREVFVFYSFE